MEPGWLAKQPLSLVTYVVCRPPIDKQHSANCQLNLLYNDSIFYPEFFRSLLLNDPRAASAHTEPDSVDFRACILFISVTSVTLPVFGTSVVYSFWINDLLYLFLRSKQPVTLFWSHQSALTPPPPQLAPNYTMQSHSTVESRLEHNSSLLPLSAKWKFTCCGSNWVIPVSRIQWFNLPRLCYTTLMMEYTDADDLCGIICQMRPQIYQSSCCSKPTFDTYHWGQHTSAHLYRARQQ